MVENQKDGKPGHLADFRLRKIILRVVLAHVIVLLSRVHPVNYKPFTMSHHVSILNSFLIDFIHHLLWLNLYLWQMQIPLLIDCDPKSPLLMVCTACDLSNTITQRCTAKTALTPFSMCHARLSPLHLTFWRQTGVEEAAEETLIPNFSPCHYGPVWPPISSLWVMWETWVLSSQPLQARLPVLSKPNWKLQDRNSYSLLQWDPGLFMPTVWLGGEKLEY